MKGRLPICAAALAATVLTLFLLPAGRQVAEATHVQPAIDFVGIDMETGIAAANAPLAASTVQRCNDTTALTAGLDTIDVDIVVGGGGFTGIAGAEGLSGFDFFLNYNAA